MFKFYLLYIVGVVTIGFPETPSTQFAHIVDELVLDDRGIFSRGKTRKQFCRSESMNSWDKREKELKV